MTSAEAVPVRRGQVVSTDVDETTALMSTRWVGHRPTFSGQRSAFTFRLTSISVQSAAGWFHADRFRHTLGVHAPTDPARDLLLTVPLGGTLRHTAGREATSSVCLVPYWTPCVTDWDDVDVAVALLDLDGVRRVGADMAGVDPEQVEFTGWRPISRAWGDVVASTLGHVRAHVLASQSVADSPIVRGEAFRHLATTMLAAFPNSTHTLALAGRHSGEPATVRRAVEFIDAHAGEDIDIAQIADAARISSRGLQSAFRRHRGQSPTEYLRQARLDGAHRDLQSGDPTRGDSVGEIAARWGFRHPGRFAVLYRRAYGYPPGRTLRG